MISTYVFSRYVKSFKPVTGKVIGDPLHKHHLYSCAIELMKERFPGCLTTDEACLIIFLLKGLANCWMLVIEEFDYFVCFSAVKQLLSGLMTSRCCCELSFST
jgi:hypothetical protein